MLPQSHLAVVTRNVTWDGGERFATEPFECGWAREALVFVRALKPPIWTDGPDQAQVQVSPDGMHWADHGTRVVLPARQDEMTVARIAHFGGWLRLAGLLRPTDRITVLVSIHLKA